MRSFLTVISFTYRQATRLRSFRISTLLLLVLVVAGIVIPSILTKRAAERAPVNRIVILYDRPAPIPVQTGVMNQIFGGAFEISTGTLAQKSEDLKALHDGKLSGVIVLSGSQRYPYVVNYPTKGATAYWPALLAYFQEMHSVQALKHAGLSASVIRSALGPLTHEQVSIPSSAQPFHSTHYVTTYALEFAIYMFVLLYGMNIMMSVASEKSSRVQELLISSVPTTPLMFGKLVGTCLVGLTQFVLLLAAGFATNQMVGGIPSFHLARILTPEIFMLFVLLFMLGYFQYATLYAAAASLVSRVEEVSASAQPFTTLFVLSFVAGLFTLQMPNAQWATILSFVPLFAPTVLFARVGMATVPVWQVVVSVSLLLTSTIVTGVVAANVYRMGVMFYGKRPSFRQVLGWLRQSR